jgi:hypothetical protein
MWGLIKHAISYFKKEWLAVSTGVVVISAIILAMWRSPKPIPPAAQKKQNHKHERKDRWETASYNVEPNVETLGDSDTNKVVLSKQEEILNQNAPESGSEKRGDEKSEKIYADLNSRVEALEKRVRLIQQHLHPHIESITPQVVKLHGKAEFTIIGRNLMKHKGSIVQVLVGDTACHIKDRNDTELVSSFPKQNSNSRGM